MARIFICYRRENAKGFAGRIYDQLLQMRIPAEDVFYDRESLRPGDPWPDYIARQFRDCELLLVVMQKGWVSERLKEPNDWVRQEIEAGLSNKMVRAVPVLVGDSPEIPKAESLPGSIQGLVDREAFTIDEQDFRGSVERMMKKIAAAKRPEPEPLDRLSRQIRDCGTDLALLRELSDGFARAGRWAEAVRVRKAEVEVALQDGNREYAAALLRLAEAHERNGDADEASAARRRAGRVPGG